jgi:cytochrome c-type biogenesis protein CcmE
MVKLFVVFAMTAFVVPALAAAQADKPAPKMTLEGTLKSGKVAVGGETTGWELSYTDATGKHAIEVAFSKALLQTVRNGQNVRITGTIVTRDRVERGPVRVLVASEVEEVKDPPK